MYVLYCFLLTTFLMDGPKPETPAPMKNLSGVDNVVFTAGDETNLPTITALVANTKRVGTESSRL
ncbi:hypothetical protein NQ314_020257 [Rhamnusium bicolor]|uniref:Uncharacterized protein n=1 Tax=Rhamnusium bicolor TaxID=1586634 RepID=A0AAV8WKM3_9CUCU|nr:hypothetical protein NQ314_020257 [Rhamnusium bicolor]